MLKFSNDQAGMTLKQEVNRGGKAMDVFERMKERSFKTGDVLVFHAVGGAWRSITSMHMEISRAPLHILQNYEIEAKAQEILLKYGVTATSDMGTPIEDWAGPVSVSAQLPATATQPAVKVGMATVTIRPGVVTEAWIRARTR